MNVSNIMLTQYDLLVESLINEGRKSDDLKKFKLNFEKVKNAVETLEDSHEDKAHFRSIISKLKEKDFYTPKTLKNAVSLIFKQLKKGEIAEGYAKLFYEFLKNHDDDVFDAYTEETTEENEPEVESDDSEEVESDEIEDAFGHLFDETSDEESKESEEDL